MSFAEKPLAMQFGGAVNDGNGYLGFSLAFEASLMKFERGGWFSNGKYVEVRLQRGIVVNLFERATPVYLAGAKLGQDSLIPLNELAGLGLVDRAEEFSNWGNWPLFRLGPFEVVNGHQWEGLSPIEFRNERGIVYAQEPPMWDVAAVDQGTGARVLALRCHNRKDDVFQFCNSLNIWLEWMRDTVRPFRDLIEEQIPTDAKNLDHASDDDNDKWDMLWNQLFLPMWDNMRATIPEAWEGYLIDNKEDPEEGFKPYRIRRPKKG